MMLCARTKDGPAGYSDVGAHPSFPQKACTKNIARGREARVL
jgi:hypothetical protein